MYLMIKSVFTHAHAVKPSKCAGFHLGIKKTFIVPAFASNGLNIFSSPDLRERGLFEIALPQSSWNTGRETFVRLQTGLLYKIISLGPSIFFSLVGNIMKFTLACALQFALQARLVHFRLDSNLRRQNYEMQQRPSHLWFLHSTR